LGCFVAEEVGSAGRKRMPNSARNQPIVQKQNPRNLSVARVLERPRLWLFKAAQQFTKQLA